MSGRAFDFDSIRSLFRFKFKVFQTQSQRDSEIQIDIQFFDDDVIISLRLN